MPPVNMPPEVTLRDLDLININPSTGALRTNVTTAGVDEVFIPVKVADKPLKYGFQHKRSKERSVDRFYSIDSFKKQQAKGALAQDETGEIKSLGGVMVALFYNDFQGRPQFAGGVVICDLQGKPLPL